MSVLGHSPTEAIQRPSRSMSASLIGRLGVKHFQTIHRCSVDVAHGLALLFGIGTRALPSWDPRTRWNNLLRGLSVRLTIGPSGHAPPRPTVPRGTSFHRWVELEFSPIASGDLHLLMPPRPPGSTGVWRHQPICGA